MKSIFPFLLSLIIAQTLLAQNASPLHNCFVNGEPTHFYKAPERGEQPLGARSLTVLPVVVHVLYTQPPNDILDAEVAALIELINHDFRRLNADTANTPDAFKPVAADTEIEFALADTDPQGNPTSGVTHTQVAHSVWSLNELGYHAMKFDSTGGKSAWAPAHYVNIWLLPIMLPSTGHSSLPFQHGEPTDGVVAAHFYNPLNNYRTITHYLGHYLGLSHLWGNESECSTQPGGHDELEDTPNQLGPVLTLGGQCPDFPTTDDCSPDFPGVMFMNFMETGQQECQNLFTGGQAAAMHYVIDSVRQLLLVPPAVGPSPVVGPTEGEALVFPNPVSGDLQVRNLPISEGPLLFEVRNVLGRRVLLQRSAGVAEEVLRLEHLPQGSYFLRIMGERGQLGKALRLQKN